MSTPAPAPARVQIDPRGPRFTATLTSVVLAAVLVLPVGPVALVLLAVQTALFALGSARGIQHTPVAWLFRRFVRPRLSAPDHLEDAAPPRFAQAVGLGFGLVALAGYVTGLTLLGQVATGFALAAALLNAVFGLCLGCEVYLLLHRSLDGVAPARRGRDHDIDPSHAHTKEEVTA